MYSFRASLGRVEVAFTDRLGGVSQPPYESLNLAVAGLDDPAARAENLRRVLDDFAPGDELADLDQVHGAQVVVLDPTPPARAQGDALVADRPGVVLAVRVADCVPVLLADPDAGVVGAAHAGRAGLLAGVLPATVRAMRERGAHTLTAWIGPHVCGACYEVPEQMREAAARVEPATAATTSWGTPALDLGAGARAQLEREGVTVRDAARCTRESPELYSHRRDGERAGRLAALVRLTGQAGGRP